MMCPQFTFRLDAGPAEGLGHLQRCAVLASFLRKEGHPVRFVCRSTHPVIAQRLEGFEVFYLDPAGTAAAPAGEAWDARATLQAVGAGSGSDWMVVDHYQLGLVWEELVGRAGYKVAAIDDFRTRRHSADLLVSDSPAPFDPCLNATKPNGRVLTGPLFLLLGTEYFAGVDRPINSVGNILVTYGAADPTGETAKASQAIAHLVEQGRLTAGISVHLAVGPYNAASEALADAARSRGQNLHIAPASLTSLMQQADLVITAGGNSLVEALALMRPCVVTVTADNQRLIVRDLQAGGMIHVVGESDAVSVSALGEAIANTAPGIEMWARRIAAAKPFDGAGAARICEAMLALIANGKALPAGVGR